WQGNSCAAGAGTLAAWRSPPLTGAMTNPDIKPGRDVAILLDIMARLRGPGGCPWDSAQSFATIAPYTIEEAYEVATVIQDGDLKSLPAELGDLLFQAVLPARMAEPPRPSAF